MSKPFKKISSIQYDDLSRVLFGIGNDIGLTSAVVLDALYHTDNNATSSILGEFLEKNGDRISVEKLQGVMIAIKEWQIRNSPSGVMLDVLLKLIGRRILGGDADDATWINHALDIISSSYSFHRLKNLITLLYARNPIPIECKESYLYAIQNGLQFAQQNTEGYPHLCEEIYRLADSKDETFAANKNILETVASLIKQNLNAKPGKLLLFIHGLGGDKKKSWGQFADLVEGDIELQDEIQKVAFFEYPSSLFSIPMIGKKNCDIHLLSDSLRTQILLRYSMSEEIIFVCHSLGGLIAKNYLINEERYNRPHKIQKVIYFATPHNGSSLANIGSLIRFKHNQLRQLCRNSEFLEILNKEWDLKKMDGKLKQQYVYGGQDRIVSKESAKSKVSDKNLRVISKKDHRSITKPNDSEDDSFLLLKSFIIDR